MIYIVHKYHQNEKYFSQIWDSHEDLCKRSPAQLKHGPRIAAGAVKKSFPNRNHLVTASHRKYVTQLSHRLIRYLSNIVHCIKIPDFGIFFKKQIMKICIKFKIMKICIKIPDNENSY